MYIYDICILYVYKIYIIKHQQEKGDFAFVGVPKKK